MAYPSHASSLPQLSEIETENQRSSPATTIDSSAASASTSASTAADPMVYDVFINHRGPDTKKTFAAALYRRLLSQGFRAFLDQNELQVGSSLISQIAGAIRGASVHVAIFSPTYSESSWCLQELVLMLESTAPIIPVFYKVTPSKLRYGEELRKLEMKMTCDPQTGMSRPRYDSATVQNWRNALSSVADKSGFDLEGAFNGDEMEMLDKVVERVVKMFKNTEIFVAKYPIGLDDKVQDFETAVLKRQHRGEVQIVGIVGLGGVGKTTLAKELFNRKRSSYNKSYFLADVRENARSSSLHSLQSKVMKGIIQVDLKIDSIDEGIEILRRYLQSSHVLLVLDDIDHVDQLDALLPVKDVLHSDSLILITSRNKDVLVMSGLEEACIYRLRGLPVQHSRELFCSYAFRHPYPLCGFEDLVDKFLVASDGLPLVLKVFGTLLFGNNDKSFWEDRLYQVQVPSGLQKSLKISYDALNEEEKQIFLDIACFFIGEKKNTAVTVWDGSGWKGLLGIQNLESKSLVEVDSDNYIHMHDHLRDLGREIAEDKLPRRLWRPSQIIDDLSQQSSVITQVRGFRMFPEHQRRSRQPLGNHLMKLRNRLHNARNRFLGIGVMKLQIIQTEGHLLERILRRVHSPNLIFLSWLDCPYSYLPSWIPMKNLRVLKVEGRVLKTLWQAESQAPLQLRELEISATLSNISRSIGQLKHLERIVFHNVDLQKLPDEFCSLKSLKALVLRWCSELKALPDIFGNLRNLQHIELSTCSSLERLPDSFGKLTNLEHMELSTCSCLERLPDSFGKLTNLEHMELSACGSLEGLPDSFGNLTNLQRMKLSGCGRFERLPGSFGNLTNLQHMELSGCGSLESLPDSFGSLINLQHIELPGSGSLERLPDSFGNLSNLQYMDLAACRSLERLPDSFGNLTKLQYIYMFACANLERLPDSLGYLRNLQHIELSACRSLERLPDSFGNLRNLQHIELSDCWSLEMLPDSFVNLRNLQHIDLSGCVALERLPDSFGNLNNLQYINLSGCVGLERLPDSFGNLTTNLQFLDLSNCKNLEESPSIRTLLS